MQPVSFAAPPSLRDLTEGGGAAAGIRFVADANRRADIADWLHTGQSADLKDRLRGSSVLLAMPRQLDTIAALLALDGVARRIVLWPQDRPSHHLSHVIEAAGIDVVVTDWPPPGATLRAIPCAAGVDDAGKTPRTQTEWVLFTSGTSGQSKMVVHTLHSLAGHLADAGAAPVGQVWCTFYDIRRYGGLQIALRALAGGGSLVLSDPDESVAAFLARAAGAGATHFLGTPSHWRRALMADAADVISPAYVRLSGEVADQVILDRLRAAYPQARLVHAFASTEAGLAFEVTDALAGFPAELLMRNPLAAEIRVSNRGLQVRSARNAAGYLDGRMASLMEDEGFVETGDVVELREGRYHFAGRRDGIVNVGGQKVHPEEIESVINQHPAVHISLVAGRPNPITGAIVVAQVVPRRASVRSGEFRSGSSRDLEDDIRVFCRDRLAPYKVPTKITVVASLEIAPTGKLVRPGA